MKYRSTRGGVSGVSLERAMLEGIAPDGGLYVPERWPVPSAEERASWRKLPYPALVARIAAMFGAGDESTLADLAVSAYADFERLAPVTDLGGGRHLLELFWGPTFAFKDYALQFLGRLLDETLARSGRHLVVIGATSGDTGSAAIAACRDRGTLDVVILHPHGRVSEIQRRQMTTVLSDNVHNLAIEGTFDDAQRIVKALLTDIRGPLSSVNSINWVRVLAQIPYYAWAWRFIDAPMFDVAVPTGNFGNVLSAWIARRIGVPIRFLLIGTNVNRAVVRFLDDGVIAGGEVRPTLAPAMDIQVPSNLERLLFDLLDGDTDRLGRMVRSAPATFPEDGLRRAREVFRARSFDDEEIISTMRTVYQESGRFVDPHTAVGVAAAGALAAGDVPVLVVGTAHPAKFAETVRQATGTYPPVPDALGKLSDRSERYEILPADRRAVEAFLHASVLGKLPNHP